YREALALFQEIGDQWGSAAGLAGLGRALAAQAEATGPAARAAGLTQAVHLLAAAAALLDRIGIVFDPQDRIPHERAVAAARVALGAERFAAAWTAGQAAPLAAAVAEAL